MQQVGPGQIWRHQNGTDYEVDCVTQKSEKSYQEVLERREDIGPLHQVLHTESLKYFYFWRMDGRWWHEPEHGDESCVVYFPCILSKNGSEGWARPLLMFLGDRNGSPRFELIADIEAFQMSEDWLKEAAQIEEEAGCDRNGSPRFELISDQQCGVEGSGFPVGS